MNILELVAEPLPTHPNMLTSEMERQVEELLKKVGVSSEYMNRYPHQLSGGQAQRVKSAAPWQPFAGKRFVIS